jgi:hypothetical protein
MRAPRVMISTLSVFAIAWLFVVPLAYLVTFDDEVATRWLEGSDPSGMVPKYPRWFLGAYLGVHFVIIPALLAWTAIALRGLTTRFPNGLGLAMGAIWALWASTVLLAIPYIGVYPNLISALVGAIASGGRNSGPSYFVTAMLVNLVLWTLIGWLLLRPRRAANGACVAAWGLASRRKEAE